MACPVCDNPREIIYTPSDVHDGWRKGDRRYYEHLVCHTCKTRLGGGRPGVHAHRLDPDAPEIIHDTYAEWPDFDQYEEIEPALTVGELLSNTQMPPPEPDANGDERYIFGPDEDDEAGEW